MIKDSISNFYILNSKTSLSLLVSLGFSLTLSDNRRQVFHDKALTNSGNFLLCFNC